MMETGAALVAAVLAFCPSAESTPTPTHPRVQPSTPTYTHRRMRMRARLHFVEEEGPPPAARELLGDDLVVAREVRLAARADPHLRAVQAAVVYVCVGVDWDRGVGAHLEIDW